MTIIEAELVEQPADLDAGMPVDVEISSPRRGVMRLTLTDTWGATLKLEADYDDLGYEIMAPAAEIIDEIARRNPVAGLGGRCYYCDAWPVAERAHHPEEHREACLWRRARSL